MNGSTLNLTRLSNLTNAPMLYIYLNFCKAFDSVPHHELLCKLHSFKISKVWRWFHEYLSSRQQAVCAKYWRFFLSAQVFPKVVAILGLLLFIMYVKTNPIISTMHCTIYFFFFADDAKCIQIIDQPSDYTLMQANLTSFSKWSDK